MRFRPRTRLAAPWGPAARTRAPDIAAWIVVAGFALPALAMLPACGPGTHARAQARHWVRAAYDSTFARDVTGARRPTVVYYWSNGCVPCMWYGPHVERAARRYAGRIAFWKLEMGWSARRVQLYGIPAVPTLVFYLGDRELDHMQGAPSPNTDDSVAVFLDRGLKLAAAAGWQPTPVTSSQRVARRSAEGASERARAAKVGRRFVRLVRSPAQ